MSSPTLISKTQIDFLHKVHLREMSILSYFSLSSSNNSIPPCICWVRGDVICPSTSFSIREKSVTNWVKLELQVVMTVDTSPGACVSLTFRNDTVPSPQWNGLCSAFHFPSNCSWTVWTRAGLHISYHPFLPVASYSPHLESRGLKDFGVKWGKYAGIDLRIPRLQLPIYSSCTRAC